MSTRSRRRPVPVPAPCAPVGSLVEPARCLEPRDCSCGASLHLTPNPEGAGLFTYRWRDEGGRIGVHTYPWGTTDPVEPEGWWEWLAKVDIGAYSALRARVGLGMAGEYHRHEPTTSCVEHDRPQPDLVPFCCDRPMWLLVDGWRCREQRTLFPFAVDLEPAA